MFSNISLKSSSPLFIKWSPHFWRARDAHRCHRFSERRGGGHALCPVCDANVLARQIYDRLRSQSQARVRVGSESLALGSPEEDQLAASEVHQHFNHAWFYQTFNFYTEREGVQGIKSVTLSVNHHHMLHFLVGLFTALYLALLPLFTKSDAFLDISCFCNQSINDWPDRYFHEISVTALTSLRFLGTLGKKRGSRGCKWFMFLLHFRSTLHMTTWEHKVTPNPEAGVCQKHKAAGQLLSEPTGL